MRLNKIYVVYREPVTGHRSPRIAYRQSLSGWHVARLLGCGFGA